jgi:threonine 3-dehydrogenase
MAEQMWAGVKTESAPGADFKQVDIPKITDDQVLIKVKAASICGTDRHIYNWDPWAAGRMRPPLIFGHECCGEVVEVGKSVKTLRVGNVIAAESHIPCGVCKQCRMGNMHICNDLTILGVDVNGVFAEYAALPELVCWKVSPKLDPAIASIHEPFGNSVYTVMSGDVATKRIAIIGDGPTAAFACAIAKTVGAEKIYNLGMQEFNLGICRTMGADVTINVKNDKGYVERIIDETSGGVDVVLDMAGNQPAIDTGFQVLRKAGTYCMFGIPPDSVKIDINSYIIFKGATVYGINGRKMFETWYQMSALLSGGMIDPSPAITHRFPFSDFLKAIDIWANNKEPACKMVLLME